MINLTATMSTEEAYVYQCKDHPECGGGFHVIAKSALEAKRKSTPGAFFFQASHIPAVWDSEWDWDNQVEVQ